MNPRKRMNQLTCRRSLWCTHRHHRRRTPCRERGKGMNPHIHSHRTHRNSPWCTHCHHRRRLGYTRMRRSPSRMSRWCKSCCRHKEIRCRGMEKGRGKGMNPRIHSQTTHRMSLWCTHCHHRRKLVYMSMCWSLHHMNQLCTHFHRHKKPQRRG